MELVLVPAGSFMMGSEKSDDEKPAHRVSICYQISEFGPGLKVLVDLTRELVARHKLFV